MVTLNVKIAQSQTDVRVIGIALDQHSPIDVIKKVALLAPKKKPPSGTIWLMRPLGWRVGDPVLDQFETFNFNAMDDTISYELVVVG